MFRDQYSGQRAVNTAADNYCIRPHTKCVKSLPDQHFSTVACDVATILVRARQAVKRDRKRKPGILTSQTCYKTAAFLKSN